MKLELAKRRSTYALGTFADTWTLTVRRFFPLFLGWIATLAIPVTIMVITVITGGILDWNSGWEHAGWWTLAGLLIPGFMIGGLWAGWNFIALKVVRGLPVKWTDIFRPLPQTLSALVALSISSVLIGLGMILIVPGALLFLRWQLAAFYIVDRNYGPIRALRQSWHDTEMVFVPLGIFDLMMVGVGALSSAVIAGPFMCHMASTVGSAIVYNKWLTDENNPDLPQIEDHD